MGELQHEPFQVEFNGFLKVAFQGSRITSDAGLILVRELDERLGLATLISEHLNDSRQGLNTQFGLVDLLRQSVYNRLAGYEDLNDAVRVSADPTFRLIGSPKRWDRGCGADVDVALVRDRATDPRGESRRAEGSEPGGARAGLTLPPETVPARALEFGRNDQEAGCHASGTAPSKSSPHDARPRWR